MSVEIEVHCRDMVLTKSVEHACDLDDDADDDDDDDDDTGDDASGSKTRVC